MAEMSSYGHHLVMRRFTVVACVALLSTLLPLGPAEAGKVAVFEGGGWGHGIGMSQYGAYGRATNGATSASILQHYYSGTNVVNQSDRIPATVRIGLLQAQSDIALRQTG